MKRKVLIFGMTLSMSVFGMTQLVAADYQGTVPSDRLLAWGDDPDPLFDTDGDGVPDDDDICPGPQGDADHCGCPDNLVTVSYTPFPTCTLINDPDQGGNLNDSEGVPVGGGLLLLLASAVAYGATVKRKNRNNGEK
ncbi:MAG: hypothetical protein LBS01_03985 [Prevotellaceae bacterium]|jgi:hypothetical protein|nr:hypothetical protein [Prevotellaceae bacterium]